MSVAPALIKQQHSAMGEDPGRQRHPTVLPWSSSRWRPKLARGVGVQTCSGGSSEPMCLWHPQGGSYHVLLCMKMEQIFQSTQPGGARPSQPRSAQDPQVTTPVVWWYQPFQAIPSPKPNYWSSVLDLQWSWGALEVPGATPGETGLCFRMFSAAIIISVWGWGGGGPFGTYEGILSYPG